MQVAEVTRMCHVPGIKLSPGLLRHRAITVEKASRVDKESKWQSWIGETSGCIAYALLRGQIDGRRSRPRKTYHPLEWVGLLNSIEESFPDRAGGTSHSSQTWIGERTQATTVFSYLHNPPRISSSFKLTPCWQVNETYGLQPRATDYLIIESTALRKTLICMELDNSISMI
jgi:hypothetical protein